MASETSSEQLGLRMTRHERDVACDTVERDGGWYWVSTVQLTPTKYDHLMTGLEPFETMIWEYDPMFGAYVGDPIWEDRYNTKEEAEAGHANVLENWPL